MPYTPDYDVEEILEAIEPLCVGRPAGYRSVLLLDWIMYGPPTDRRLQDLHRANYKVVYHHNPPKGPGEWVERAACHGQRMYYETFMAYYNRISRKDREMEIEALETCRSCPVLDECRAWALQDTDPAVDHVAGGLTPRERAERRRRRHDS